MSVQKEKQAFDFDLSYLSDIAGGSKEFMVDMLDIFLSQTPLYFDQLEEAVLEKNWLTVANIAHKIKPALDMMGLKCAKEHITSIEFCARRKENPELIKSEFYQLRAISDDIFNGLHEIKLGLGKQ